MKCLLIVIFQLLTLVSCSKDNEIFETAPPTESSMSFRIIVGSTTFDATFYDTPASKAFQAMLPLTLNMSDFNSNEKVCSLPRGLATSAANPRTIQTGEIMLYGSNSLVLFYETFSTSYSYTRIGRVDNISGLKTALGAGSATIKFESK